MPDDWRDASRRQRGTKRQPPPKGIWLTRRTDDKSIERLIDRIQDPLHRDYLRYFFMPNVQRRILVAASKLAWKFRRRHRGGSAEFELEPDDLIQHAFELFIRSGIRFANSATFTEVFVDRMQNYERAQRRRLKARAQVDGTPELLDRQPAAASVHSQPEPSPEATVLDRDALERVHRLVCIEAPDLEPLLMLMFQGMLERATLADTLGITPNALDLLRRRLHRLARRAFES